MEIQPVDFEFEELKTCFKRTVTDFCFNFGGEADAVASGSYKLQMDRQLIPVDYVEFVVGYGDYDHYEGNVPEKIGYDLTLKSGGESVFGISLLSNGAFVLLQGNKDEQVNFADPRIQTILDALTEAKVAGQMQPIADGRTCTS